MSRYRIGMSSVGGSAWTSELQVKPVSSLQSWEHPSPSWTLPSSHSSCGNLRPSPHTAVHSPLSHLGSIMQVAEQPSNGIRLPSSHCSLPSFTLSPHTVARHTLPGHTKPGCTVHVAEQPRFRPLFGPRSHCSLPRTLPSPQSGMQGRAAFGHTQPSSTMQVAEQPSLGSLLP